MFRTAFLAVLGLCSLIGCARKQASPGVDAATPSQTDAPTEAVAQADTGATTMSATDATTETTIPAIDAGTEAAVSMDDGGSSPNPPRICDGSSIVRLAVRWGGGGPTEPGVAMLSEIGYRFLFVDGTCHAWVQLSAYDSMRELTLTAEREQALISALKISTWKDISGPTTGGCADGPSIEYRFEQQHLSGPTCGGFIGTAWSNLNESFYEQIVALAELGVPATGRVRYLLERKSSTAPNDARSPVAWPLSNIDPGAFALPENSFQYEPGDSQGATGADATALRAIRTTTSASSTGPTIYFTPVRGSDGALYFLYIRDSLPFESDNGLLPTDLF